MINLERPLVVLDTETTGTDPDIDRIVQIALVGAGEHGIGESWLVNPGCPIPPEATEIHGITDADVREARTFRGLWPELASIIGDADLCIYNAKFDLGMIAAECKRNRIEWKPTGRIIDPLVIFRARMPHTLPGAMSYYSLGEHKEAHDALADCRATLLVLEAQAAESFTPATIDDLAAESIPPKDPRWVDGDRKFYWRFGAPTFAFGKHRGYDLSLVAVRDRGYLTWMLKQEYGPEVDKLITDALRGVFPTRPVPAEARA